MDFFLSKVVAQLILPPAGALLLGVLGLLLLGWRRRLAVLTLLLSLVSLLVLSSPFIGSALSRSLAQT